MLISDEHEKSFMILEPGVSELMTEIMYIEQLLLWNIFRDHYVKLIDSSNLPSGVAKFWKGLYPHPS